MGAYFDAEEEVLESVCRGLERLASQNPERPSLYIPDAILDLSGCFAVRSMEIWRGFQLAEGPQEQCETKALEDCRSLAIEVSHVLSNDCDEMMRLCKRHSELRQQRERARPSKKREPSPPDKSWAEKEAALVDAVDSEVLYTRCEEAQSVREMILVINDAIEGKFRKLDARYAKASTLIKFGPIVAGAALEHWLGLGHVSGLSAIRELFVAWISNRMALPRLEASQANKKRMAIQQSLLILPLLPIPSAVIVLAYFRRELEEERVRANNWLVPESGGWISSHRCPKGCPAQEGDPKGDRGFMKRTAADGSRLRLLAESEAKVAAQAKEVSDPFGNQDGSPPVIQPVYLQDQVGVEVPPPGNRPAFPPSFPQRERCNSANGSRIAARMSADE